jgi:hypothetical protein
MFIEDRMFLTDEMLNNIWIAPDDYNTSSPEEYSSPEEISQVTLSPKKHRVIKKQRWTEEEDNQLEEAAKKHGAKNWSFIATFVPSRTAKQCRERWIVHHDKNYTRKLWTKQEDDLLIMLQSQLGNKFSKISKMIENRSPIEVKNRWKFLKNHNLTDRPENTPNLEVDPFDSITECFDNFSEF